MRKLEERKTLDKLARIVCRFDMFPEADFEGVVNVLRALNSKFKAKLDSFFTKKTKLFETLLLLVFPFYESNCAQPLEFTPKQSVVVRKLQAQQNTIRSILYLLKSICIENNSLIQSMALHFSSFLQQ